MKDYLNGIIKPITNVDGEIVLIMDELSSHHTENVVKLMDDINARAFFFTGKSYERITTT